MIDAHCHLNFPNYKTDLEEVIKRAFDKGVEKIINAGTSVEDSKKAVELSEKFENLFSIVGVHPHDAKTLQKDWLEEIEELAKKPKTLAIGEIGLDYFNHKDVDKKIQKEVFSKQIELAIKLKLPLQIHSRKAANDVIDILKSFKNELPDRPGMFHCMSGDLDYLSKVLDLGFYVGFDGNITYKGLAPGENTPLKDLVAYSPLNRIVCETDSPFLTPVPFRGGVNEPSYVIIVAENIAKIKDSSFEEIEEKSTQNVNELFKLNNT